MKKQRIKNYLKLGILLFGVSLIFITCQNDDNFSNQQKQSLKEIPIIKTLNFDNTSQTFNRLNSELKLQPYFKAPFSNTYQTDSNSNTDSLGFTLDTNIIKEVTLGNYKSYTMRIVNSSDNNIFYNLTIEEKNNTSQMFVTQYAPTENWLNNQSQSFSGNIRSRKTTLTEYTDPDELFEEGQGSVLGNPGLGSGPGGGGTVAYNPNYPTNCFGTVIVTTELEAYQCDCSNHWPWDICTCADEGGKAPGYNQIYNYTCQDDWEIDPYDPDDNYGGGSGSGGGGGTVISNPDNDSSIGVMITPEECTEPITGDLDGDCVLNPYEICVLNEYSDDVCNCVNQGNAITDCLTNNCNKLKAISDIPLVKTRLHQLRGFDDQFERGFKIDKNPTNNSYRTGAIIPNNTNNCNSVIVPTHAYTAIIVHTHPSCVGYKMFSAEDILKLAKMANLVQNDENSTVKLTELTNIVVFNGALYEGTFAIRFDDEASVQALQTIANNKDKRSDFIDDLKESYKSDFNNTTGIDDTSIAKQQEHLFNHLQQYGISMSLYQASFDSDNRVDNWKKINKVNLEQEDCN